MQITVAANGKLIQYFLSQHKMLDLKGYNLSETKHNLKEVIQRIITFEIF